MKRASDYTRELASGIADINTRRTARAPAAGNFVGFLLVFALGMEIGRAHV